MSGIDDRSADVSRDLRERLLVLEQTQRATLNILEDFDSEKAKLHELQMASMNLLDDFVDERRNHQRAQTAALNLLEDMSEERDRLDETRRALTNILEDADEERANGERSRALTEAANKELEAFCYSVSHDLRAPLRAVTGFADAVLEDYAPRLDDEGKRYLHFISENAARMGQLIDDLLSFSRLGRQQMVKTDLDLSARADVVAKELAAAEAGRDIEFVINAVPLARGDRAMIQQVLVNLFSNAIKFTRPRAKAVIEFGWAADPQGGSYYVRDNGVGFDMKYDDKLFGVFQRLHPDTEFEGTGVGLALVHRIITRHGGRIWADADVDQGATFFFTLEREES